MPSIEGGGVEKNLFLLSNFLSPKLNITIITADNFSKKKFTNKVNFISPKSNFFYKKKKYLKYLICLFLLFKEFLKNKNIAVFSFQANIYAILFAKLLGLKIITRSNTSPSGWSSNFIKFWIFKKVLKFSDLIIVNSQEFKKQMENKFKVKCKLILNPLNLNTIVNKSNEKLNFIFFNNNSLNLINVARLTDQKDHLTLLKAIKILSEKINIKLLILGSGVNKNKINNFIIKNRLKENIKLLSFQSNPYKFIKRADILVLSSSYEGLPNVLLEGIALKKFIISSNCPTGPKEILNSGKFGFLFKVGSEEELVIKILKYLKLKKKCKKMITNSYKNLNKYDFNKNCNIYYDCIKKYLLN